MQCVTSHMDLAMAPKCNALYMVYNAARHFVQQQSFRPVLPVTHEQHFIPHCQAKKCIYFTLNFEVHWL